MASPWLQTDQRTALRTLLKDNTSDNFLFQQPVLGVTDGQNKVFSLGEKNILASSVTLQWLSQGIQILLANPADYTGPDSNGIVTLSMSRAAPDQSVRLFASYNFTQLSDSEIDEALLRGAQQIGLPTNLNLNANTGDIIEGLRPAMLGFSQAQALKGIWVKAAERYTTTAKDQEYSLSDLNDHYQKLIESVEKEATNKRADFYKRQGRREAATVAPAGYWISPITPIR